MSARPTGRVVRSRSYGDRQGKRYELETEAADTKVWFQIRVEGGSQPTVYLTPAKARALAKNLLLGARNAERNRGG